MEKAYLAYFHGWKEGPAVRLQFNPFETYCPVENDRPQITLSFVDWTYKCKSARNKTELRHWGGHISKRWKFIESK